MKIMVGSQNAAKMGAVRNAATAYWPEAVVDGAEVDSGVPGQPIGLEQTTQGALNRARAAYELGADLGIGLEGGVMEMAGRMVLFGVVGVFDGEKQSAATTVATPLPDAWGKALKKGEELGPLMAKLFKDYNRKIGAMPFLTKGQILREDAFTQAVKGALAPWVTPEAYEQQAEAA